MAYFKAVLITLLVASLQGAYSSPGLFDGLKATLQGVKEKAEIALAEHVKGFENVGVKGDFRVIVEKAVAALNKAVELGQLTPQQGKEVVNRVIEAAHKEQLSPLSIADIVLDKFVKEGRITKVVKVKCLVAAVRNGDHKLNPSSLKEGAEVLFKDAVAAEVLGESTAQALLKDIPTSVEVDVDATCDAKDIEEVLGVEKDPVAVDANIRKIAEKARDTLNEAAKVGLIAKSAAEELIKNVWEAAKTNELINLSKVDICLNTGVTAGIIDTTTKVQCLANAVQWNLHKLPVPTLKAAVDAVITACAKAEYITERTAESLKKAVPSEVKPDISATTSAADIDKAAA